MAQKPCRLLVVDDEVLMLQWLSEVLRAERYDVRTTTKGRAAEEAIRSWMPDVLLTDLNLPDIDGMTLLQQALRSPQPAEVIILTGQGSIPRAVEAMHAGAFAFIEKPIEPEALRVTVRNAAEHHFLRAENQQLKQQLHAPAYISSIVGHNRRLQRMLEMVRSVAPSDANCLIVGENGAGKELVANAIHGLSHRARGPFVKINCAAIPADIMEAELFGHRRGAFTGAVADRQGLFEQANGGSLLLDEIGEMPFALQAKLLRVLQEREYRQVGGDRMLPLNVRLICATNVNVEKAVADKRLREDLYFRINTITLRVPALRERSDDIPLLCQHFLEQFRQRYDSAVRSISPAAMQRLTRYRWPGNVRELENVLERAVILTKSSEIGEDVLPPHVVAVQDDAEVDISGQEFPPHLTLEQIERLAVLQTLKHTNWNKQEAAQILGLYRPTLYSKIKRYNLEDPRARAQQAAS